MVSSSQRNASAFYFYFIFLVQSFLIYMIWYFYGGSLIFFFLMVSSSQRNASAFYFYFFSPVVFNLYLVFLRGFVHEESLFLGLLYPTFLRAFPAFNMQPKSIVGVCRAGSERQRNIFLVIPSTSGNCHNSLGLMNRI